MKTRKLTLILLCGSTLAIGQSTERSYVKSTTAQVELTGSIGSLPSTQVNTTVSYFDGLGRPIQTVSKQASPSGNDIITNVTYDQFGRQNRSYLPYEQVGASDGGYRQNWQSEINAFYNNTPANNVAEEDEHYYSVTDYEPSPLNRVLKNASEGQDWVGQGKGVAYQYLVNGGWEGIYKFSIDAFGQISSGGQYFAGTLYVNVTTDEDDKVTVEFKDILGQVVCKRAFKDPSNYGDTFYLYDDFGLLRYVVQPQGVAEMASNHSLLNEPGFRNKWMFQYEYDLRNRMIGKKVPGSGWTYMIYDNRDRLVLTQDAKQRGGDIVDVSGSKTIYEGIPHTSYRVNSGTLTLGTGFTSGGPFKASALPTPFSGQWIFTKYDALNRPVMTGIMTTTASRTDLQSAVNLVGDFSVDFTGSGSMEGYDNTSFPGTAEGVTAANLLTVTYYDGYGFYGAGCPASIPGTTAPLLCTPKGQVTGTKTRQLGGGMLTSVTYYDNRYRAVRTIADNHLGGTDVVTTDYKNGVSSLVKRVIRNHTVSGQPALDIQEVMDYDNMGRMTSQKHTLGPQAQVMLQSNTYNPIGQLIEKNIGGGVQSVDYRYNIRGWLTTINNGTALDAGENDKFGMELQYQNGPSGYKYLNGNIGKIIWKSLDDDLYTYDGDQSFSFKYDGLSRMKKAVYSGLGDYEVGGDEAGEIRYDFNGNIKSISRKNYVKFFDPSGNVSQSTRLIDNLAYGYSYGNQLSSVADLSTDTEVVDKRSGAPQDKVRDMGFIDGSNTSAEYLYDPNGNMIKDANKGISGITYNYLNLPQTVTTPQGTIHYTYDAAGTKLRKFFDRISGADETTDYIGGIQYKNGVIDFIQHSEGRALKSGSVFNYEYQLKDHLGNVRVSVNAAGSVIQRDDYYPFGLTFNSYTSGTENLYKYNGKEEQKETGLYDYGARMYDPAIGRWNHIDPMADKMRSNSPYNYAFNSPVMFVDPDGMFPIVIHVRSFAPYESFGARGWHGDNRNFSLDPGASSRLTQRTHYETSTGQYSHRHSGNMSYSNYGAFAYSESYLNDKGSGNGQIKSHLYGNNDAIFPIGTPMGGDGGPTWDIDVHTSLKITTSELDGGNQLLSITGQISGDRFPNAEAYVTDADGNQVWLGAFANQSGPDVGPFATLAGDFNRPMMNINASIVTDKNGIFTGVRVGDQTISIEQWNKDNSGPMSVDEFKEKYKDMYNSLFGNQE